MSGIELGKHNPSFESLKSISAVLNVPIDQLLHGPTTPPPYSGQYLGPIDDGGNIPLVADIPAGDWRFWEDTYEPGAAEEYVPRYDIKGVHVIAIRVDGSSMEPTLADGDILVLDPELVFMPKKGGRIGVVKFNGGYQVRRVFLLPDGNNYLVKPDNPAFDEEIVPVEGTTVFKIVDRRDGSKKREELF